MDYFINNNTDTSIPTLTPSINKCVCGISTSEYPYDTSIFPNNSTTFYTQITYNQLDILQKVISSNSIERNNIDLNLLYISESFKNLNTLIIFRFLCSPDCCDGTEFIDSETTHNVFNFVKTVCYIRPVIIELSDHSMSSFFINWNNEFMNYESPIEILKLSTSGEFKMIGKKHDFIASIHPTLKQIGELSSDENIEITFNNMNGTKIFKIHESFTNVRLISTGYDLSTSSISPVNNSHPVHCEFDYIYGKIVISSTHWCNLTNVDNKIDIPTLRRYCTDTFGVEATRLLDNTLESSSNPTDTKYIVSTMIREISSGQSCTKYNYDC